MLALFPFSLRKDKKVAEENVSTVGAIMFQVDAQLMVNSSGAAGSGNIFLVSVNRNQSSGYAKISHRNLPIPQIAVKEQLTKSPVLAFFDPRVESEIVVDASPFGLGAVLQQMGKPIAFASSTLTPAQRMSYTHIEKELLAVVYGCKKFHQTLPELQPGSSVFVQNRFRQWEPAEVLRQNEIPRSYRIRTHNGEVRTRNWIDLRPNKYSDLASFKNFTDSEEYSASDAIP
ncbi:hypothetical protein AVEN_36725-1 [Araneus ventricosus]|uniref:Reverse transcriptase/retrotransposon-derived protein RNase H-like domain-containing protein n=1 Tax=Araneus ventricosus TaxID=182803 RepID=A0A4Y2TJJ7_ARAVE|nr:hypothetical protein AVEN_36725-1 [Araneus ventricosus]